MSPDALQKWTEARRSVSVPGGFSDRVMDAVRVARPAPRSRALFAITLAACLCVVLLGQLAMVSVMLLAMPGVAQ